MSGDAGVPIELLPVGKGAYAIAWSAPWGAAAIVVRRFAEEAARSPVLLAERSRRDPPRLFHLADGVGVATCADDGAWLAVIGEDGLVSPPRPLLEGGRSLCVAAGRRSSQVFVEDGERVHLVEVRADGTIERAAAPLIERTGRVTMAAARAGEASLLFAIYEGEPRLHVVDAAKGARSRVAHELGGPARALDAYGVGARATFALADEGETVETGIVDAAGKMVERRHVALRTPGARYTHARIAWIEDDFHLVARDAAHDRAVVIRLEDRSPLLEVPRVVGPFAFAYHEKKIVLAQALSLAERPTLRLFVSDVRGSGAQTIELREPAPEAVRERRADARAERAIDELESALGSSGYRDARAARAELPRGAGVVLAAERLRVEIVPDAGRTRLVLAQLAEGDAPAPPPDGSLERLARWIRERLSRDRAAPTPADLALAAELAAAIGGELDRCERHPSGLRLELLLPDPPDGPRLAAWLHHATRSLR